MENSIGKSSYDEPSIVILVVIDTNQTSNILSYDKCTVLRISYTMTYLSYVLEILNRQSNVFSLNSMTYTYPQAGFIFANDRLPTDDPAHLHIAVSRLQIPRGRDEIGNLRAREVESRTAFGSTREGLCTELAT
jgi:hypothetical protein